MTQISIKHILILSFNSSPFFFADVRKVSQRFKQMETASAEARPSKKTENYRRGIKSTVQKAQRRGRPVA